MDASNFQLERNAFGRLVLVAATGERFDGVTPVRAFPVSAPVEGLSLLHADGHELVWIERLDATAASAAQPDRGRARGARVCA